MSAIVLTTGSAQPAAFTADTEGELVHLHCTPLGLTLRLTRAEADQLVDELAAAVRQAERVTA